MQHGRSGVIVEWDVFNHVFLGVQGTKFVSNLNRLPRPGIPDQHNGPAVLQEAIHEVSDSYGLSGVDQTGLE